MSPLFSPGVKGGVGFHEMGAPLRCATPPTREGRGVPARPTPLTRGHRVTRSPNSSLRPPRRETAQEESTGGLLQRSQADRPRFTWLHVIRFVFMVSIFLLNSSFHVAITSELWQAQVSTPMLSLGDGGTLRPEGGRSPVMGGS